MILIVGLGNPGKKFKGTRHNLGFSVLDSFKKDRVFEYWKTRKSFLAKIARGGIGGKKIILAKPQTFMNQSGLAVRALVDYYKLKTKDVWVVHDDLDLALGKAKICQKRGSGGHRGVQSIIDSLKTKDFVRFRLGIGLTKQANHFSTIRGDAERFVLQGFEKKERIKLKKTKKQAVNGLVLALQKGVDRAMASINSRN